MADAKEGFAWLREYQYNVDWFREHGHKIPQALGYLHAAGGPSTESSNILDAAYEHAMELAGAIKKLKEIADNG